MAILAFCEKDQKWANTPQLIRPDAFVASDRAAHKAMQQGINKLKHRLIAALFIALPHFNRQFGNIKTFAGYNVNVQNMSYLAMDAMNWRGDSESTLKSKIWGPSRSVVHAALPLALWAIDFGEAPAKVQEVANLAFLLLPKHLQKILKQSEIIRVNLPLIKQFRIKEEDTIQFLPNEDTLPFLPE
jgi:hypothetical protein